MEIDYFGTVWAVRAVLPDMPGCRDGVIVGVSSVLGFLGIYGYAAYSAAKFAVRGYLDVLRMEKGDLVCVYPADVQTTQLNYEDRRRTYCALHRGRPLRRKLLDNSVQLHDRLTAGGGVEVLGEASAVVPALLRSDTLAQIVTARAAMTASW